MAEQDKPATAAAPEPGGVPFYPLHFMKEVMVVVAIFTAILALSTFAPAELQEAADSFNTPAHIKPEWYFLAVYQALKYVPQGLAFGTITFLNLFVSFLGLLLAGLISLPFLDRSPHTMARRRPLFLVLGLLAIFLFLALTYLGYFSGGPDPVFGMRIP